jgi:hypothetical protein
MISIGKEKALVLHDTNWWENCSDREIAGFQLFVEELCVPFGVFHKAVESSLNRAVYTHSFALGYDNIVGEFLGNNLKQPDEEDIDALYNKYIKSQKLSNEKSNLS